MNAQETSCNGSGVACEPDKCQCDVDAMGPYRKPAPIEVAMRALEEAQALGFDSVEQAEAHAERLKKQRERKWVALEIGWAILWVEEEPA